MLRVDGFSGPGAWLATLLLVTSACADDASSSAADETETGESETGEEASSGVDTHFPDFFDPPTGETGDPPPAPDPYDPPPPLDEFDDATLVAIGEQIDAVLDAWPVSGYLQSVRIVDFETGQVVYERNPNDALKPASNTKLVTTAVAMERLGRDHRPSMEAWTDPAGNLHLVGHHDYSSDDSIFTNPTYPFYELAYRLANAGVTSVSGSSVVRGEYLVDGYSLGTYDAAAHRNLAANAWDAALAAAGISAPASSTASDFETPADGTQVARWDAPPLEVTAVPINVVSHNEFADILARHIGFELANTSSYAAGTAEMLSALADYGIDTTGFAFFGGSGLSHDNRISARGLSDLMDYVLRSDLAEAWVRTFAIAGVRGTIAGRMTGPDTAGHFYGKTGTLYDTIALSGVLFHPHDGRRYTVALLMNNDYVDIDKAAARLAQDDVVTVLAQDWRGVDPPGIVDFEFARGVDDGVVELGWAEVDGADGYVVYVSEDGWTWSRDDARYVDGPSFVAGGLGAGARTYFRVHPWSDAQGEGLGSRVLVADADDDSSGALLVDGNTRWLAGPSSENTRGLSADFLVQTAEAVPPDYSIDSFASDAIDPEYMHEAHVMIWSLGEESTTHETFSEQEQALVTSYVSDGGVLIASGAEIGWDLIANGEGADAQWFASTFHASYVADDAETYVVEPLGLEGVPATLGFFTPGHMDAAYPDVLGAVDGAQFVLEYVGGAGGGAGVVYNDEHRAALLAFPLECVDNRDDRRALVSALFAELGL